MEVPDPWQSQINMQIIYCSQILLLPNLLDFLLQENTFKLEKLRVSHVVIKIHLIMIK